MKRYAAVALAETAATGVLWGTSFPVIDFGIKSGIPPLVFASLRFGIAGLIMLMLAVAFRRQILGTLRSAPVWILTALNAVGFLAQFVGQAYTPASVAAILVNLSIIIAAVGSVIVLRERFTSSKVAGTVLALLGILLLTTKGNLSALQNAQAFGEALYLISAVSWGAYIIYNKRSTDALQWDPVAVTASIVLLTGVFMAPVMVVYSSDVTSLGTQSWSIILYTAVVNTAIPYVLYQRGLRYLTATVSSVVLMLEVVTAVVISAVFLGETLDSFSLIGAGAILVSIYLVSAAAETTKNLSALESNITGQGTASD
ncbi:MAG: DMT family transporter [Thaumarchaeota archaeon]|nr:DMT family transporter [Nitrososphaerota archaeon]